MNAHSTPHPTFARLLARAVEVTRGSTKPISGPGDLAWHLNESPQVVNNWRKRGVSESGAINAERLLGIRALFTLEEFGPADVAYEQTQARSVSQASLNIGAQDQTSRVQWGAMRRDALPDIFTVTVPDNAMADRVMKGHIARFNKHLDPRSNDGVLVEDGSGRWYLRIYEPVRGNHFKARASHADIEPLDSVRDGLTVLGVMVGVPEGRWG